MKKCVILIASLVAVFIFAGKASAHQPRLVEDSGTVIVENPEISQAFYGKLNGDKQIFEIDADKKFPLYVNILVPKIDEAQKGMVVEIMKDGMILAVLDGNSYEWTEFHEPFGGDNFWKGPEFRQEAEPGKYLIRVISPDGKGAYVLAIGEQESFPPSEIAKTLALLPSIKKQIFGKSPLTAYFNYTGLAMLAILIFIAVIIFLVVWLIRRSKKRRTASNLKKRPIHQYRKMNNFSRRTPENNARGFSDEDHSE
jgi:hypothetical protein